MQVYTTEKGIHLCDDPTLLKPTWKEEGFFETFLWDGEELLDVKRHLERVNRSLEQFYDLQLSLDEVVEKVKELVSVNGIDGMARVRLVAQVDGEVCVESLVIQPYRRPEAEVALWTSDFAPAKKSARAGHKHLKYGNYAGAYADALKNGAGEALLFNDHAELCEGSTSNVFFVKDGVVCTPSLESGCLPGIVRELVIEELGRQGVPVEEGLYSRADVVDSEGVFVTNSLRRVQAVARIDDMRIADSGSEVLGLLRNV